MGWKHAYDVHWAKKYGKYKYIMLRLVSVNKDRDSATWYVLMSKYF